MKKIIVSLGVILLAIASVFIISGDQNKKNLDGERMFVEGNLNITNPTGAIYTQRPIEFSLEIGKEYYLHYTAQKFMSNLDSDMHIKITLPEGLQTIEGNLEWIGNDRQKTIVVKFKPLKEGNYTITGIAQNLGNDFFTTNDIIVLVFPSTSLVLN